MVNINYIKGFRNITEVVEIVQKNLLMLNQVSKRKLAVFMTEVVKEFDEIVKVFNVNTVSIVNLFIYKYASNPACSRSL